MKSYMIDYARVSTRTTRKQTVLAILDAVIGVIVMGTFASLLSIVLYLIH